MSRFLFAWEQGGGLGHLAILAPLVACLAARGHEVRLAVRDLVGAARVLGDAVPALQAPFLLPGPGGAAQSGYADLLARLGFTDRAVLEPVARGWAELLRLCAPDLLVAEHSPTALLAARAMALPSAMVGTGFTCPPPSTPLPTWRAGAPVATEARVLETSNGVLTALAGAPMAQAGDLFAVPTFACTWRELDPHAAARAADAWCGPLDHAPGGRGEAPWPGGHQRRVFGYLKPELPVTAPLLEALGRLPVSALAFLPGAGAALFQRLESPNLRILTVPVALEDVLGGCRALLCHGGHGTTCAALRAGVPVLVAPGNVEQALTGERLRALGAGAVVEGARSGQALVARLRALLSDDALQAAAGDFARRHAEHDPALAAETLAGRLERLAAGETRAGPRSR